MTSYFEYLTFSYVYPKTIIAFIALVVTLQTKWTWCLRWMDILQTKFSYEISSMKMNVSICIQTLLVFVYEGPIYSMSAFIQVMFRHLLVDLNQSWSSSLMSSQITRFMGPTWGPPGSCRPQMGPILAPWTLLSGIFSLDHSMLTVHKGTFCFCLNTNDLVFNRVGLPKHTDMALALVTICNIVRFCHYKLWYFVYYIPEPHAENVIAWFS